MKHTIRYKGKFVSNNEARNDHWKKIKKKSDDLKERLWPLIINAKLPKMEMIEVLAIYRSRLDVDNVSFTVKCFVDLLVKTGRLPDDNRKHWKKLTIEYDGDLAHNELVFEINQLGIYD